MLNQNFNYNYSLKDKLVLMTTKTLLPASWGLSRAKRRKSVNKKLDFLNLFTF